MSYTFTMIKPDATERNLIGKIIAHLEDEGMKIVAQKTVILSRNQAAQFYIEHEQRDFFEDLCDYMSSAPIVALVLQANDAVQKLRDTIGLTDPKDAKQGTIRATYGLSLRHNAIHGADSEQSAKREASFFFSEYELVSLMKK